MNASEVLTAAKTARESLAKGLGALQTDPNVPGELLELATPIAQAMGALHQIERSGGNELMPHADVALSQVRSALAQLQAQPPKYDAVNNAMEAVASSLGHVHALHRAANAPQTATPTAQPPSSAAAEAPAPIPAPERVPVVVEPAIRATADTAFAPQDQPRRPGSTAIMSPEEKLRAVTAPVSQQAVPQQVALAQSAYGPMPGFPAPGAPQVALAATPAPVPQQAAPMPVPMPAPQADPFRVSDPFAAPQPQHTAPEPQYAAPEPQRVGVATGPSPMHAPQQAAPQAAQPIPGAPIPGPPPGNFPVINADLGAHSPTNFYKGLSGNDIIDHGGLFVSTYKIPKMSTQVRLRIALPGGYEFEANAVVKWVREHAETADVPPGFGAQFTAISNEARQLVYRYVRNREPIFHDDL